MKESILNELKEKYINNPTLQPTAFWKIRNWIENDETRIEGDMESRSVILDGKMLLRLPLSQGYIPQLDANYKLLIFKDKQEIGSEYKEARYFKFFHNHKNIGKRDLPGEYLFCKVTPDEYGDVVTFINNSYSNIKTSQTDVISWTKNEVYEDELWIWIIDKDNGMKIALGIADFDSIIGEGSLEWIQVNELYRGKGLGKILVNDLLYRISKKGKFTTVSGDYNDMLKPEMLYRSCGFEGDLIWHIYQRI
ncbi:MAG: GNAT family N-acetyltransferase [bacterium]|nr:GNAT family N-acetyltransferase [bacterium]